MKKASIYITLTALTLGLGTSLVATQYAYAQSTTAQTQIKKVNINTASDAELLKLPGIGSRMLKEVKEYRPFKNIAQVRRELGKYMSKAQLNTLEQYIYVK